MSEPKQPYRTETDEAQEALEMLVAGYDQPAAVIHPPTTVQALSDNGLVEYNLWGWVKVSANFIKHIKRLKGAKLAIWQCLALSIDESGTCDLTIKDICTLSGYGHTEVVNSLKELDDMGYLAIGKAGKRRLYSPKFAARGEAKPDERFQKVESSEDDDSTPVNQNDSTPQYKNPNPYSIKSLKRVKDGADAPKLPPADFPPDWQIGHDIPVTQETKRESFLKRSKDIANLIDFQCSGAGELALAFMRTRNILLPETKVKGQRKAAREMLEMKVKPHHVELAVKRLIDAKMTVTDLFSVVRTAIDIANPPTTSSESSPASMLRTLT